MKMYKEWKGTLATKLSLKGIIKMYYLSIIMGKEEGIRHTDLPR